MFVLQKHQATQSSLESMTISWAGTWQDMCVKSYEFKYKNEKQKFLWHLLFVFVVFCFVINKRDYTRMKDYVAWRKVSSFSECEIYHNFHMKFGQY